MSFFKPGMIQDPKFKRVEVGTQVYHVYRTDDSGNRKKNTAPIGTVVLLFDSDGNVARGVSVRSPDDQFNRATGRRIALARARQAMHTRTSRDIAGIPVHGGLRGDVLIRRASLDFMEVCKRNYGVVFDYKSHFNPQLTPFERKIVTEVWAARHRSGYTVETDPFLAGLRVFVECRIRGDEIPDAVTYSFPAASPDTASVP